MTLVDRHDYHQLTTELPRVATGTRDESAVQIPLDTLLSDRVRFVQTAITGFNLAERCLLTAAGPLPYEYLVLALRPFTFHDKGFVVSVGGRKGVAEIAGLTIGGRLAHALKDAIEWEYRQSIQHLHGVAAV
jgi:NADH dehydrogenase FAD-containing subunit